MDKYSISQNNGPAKRSNPKKTRGSKADSAKNSQTISPLLIAGVAAGVVIIVAGVLLVRHFGKKTNPVTGQPIVAHPIPSSAGKAVITTASFTSVTHAVENRQLSVLNRQYSSHVTVVIPRANTKKTVTPREVEDLISKSISGAHGPWNWYVPGDVIANWQQGPYGQYFTGNQIIGVSADGIVVSVGLDSNGQIDTIFIGTIGEVQVAGNTGGGSTDTTTNSGGSTTNTPTPLNPAGGPNGSD